ncbi:MAG: amino acid permease, partial [Parafilimonas sp.]
MALAKKIEQQTAMNAQNKTKTADDIITDESKIPLIRSLGLTTAILMVAGTLIGSGVFKKIAPMSAMLMNENYILLAWLLAGIISMFGAFTMAGMATMTTESGGIYEYLRLSFGNLFSFLYGWASFLIMGSGGNAAVAYVFAQSVNSVVPLPNPLDRWKDVSIGHFIYPFDSSGVKILAIVSIIVLTWINVLGAKKGGNLSNVITAAKIIGILILIFAGLFYPGAPHTEVAT